MASSSTITAWIVAMTASAGLGFTIWDNQQSKPGVVASVKENRVLLPSKIEAHIIAMDDSSRKERSSTMVLDKRLPGSLISSSIELIDDLHEAGMYSFTKPVFDLQLSEVAIRNEGEITVNNLEVSGSDIRFIDKKGDTGWEPLTDREFKDRLKPGEEIFLRVWNRRFGAKINLLQSEGNIKLEQRIEVSERKYKTLLIYEVVGNGILTALIGFALSTIITRLMKRSKNGDV